MSLRELKRTIKKIKSSFRKSNRWLNETIYLNASDRQEARLTILLKDHYEALCDLKKICEPDSYKQYLIEIEKKLANADFLLRDDTPEKMAADHNLIVNYQLEKHGHLKYADRYAWGENQQEMFENWNCMMAKLMRSEKIDGKYSIPKE